MRNKLKLCLVACSLIISYLNPAQALTETSTTQKEAGIVGSFTDSRDNKTYQTVQIGQQIWFAENFAYLPEVSTQEVAVYGYSGTSVAEAQATEAYRQFGALYSWESAHKLAPEGWRLPTDADWMQLEIVAGVPPALASQDGWREAKDAVQFLSDSGPSSFALSFGGWRTDFGEFRFQGQHVNFWVADEHPDGQRAQERLFGLNNSRIGREYGNKGCGFSVRYVRDLDHQP